MLAGGVGVKGGGGEKRMKGHNYFYLLHVLKEVICDSFRFSSVRTYKNGYVRGRPTPLQGNVEQK